MNSNKYSHITDVLKLNDEVLETDEDYEAWAEQWSKLTTQLLFN